MISRRAYGFRSFFMGIRRTSDRGFRTVEPDLFSFFALTSFKNWSGRQDLNLRPSAPKADALPDCATPRLLYERRVNNISMRFGNFCCGLGKCLCESHWSARVSGNGLSRILVLISTIVEESEDCDVVKKTRLCV